MSLKGIDVSHWQGIIDFTKLKGQIDFILVKATQGITYIDDRFTANRDGARANGILLGYYHFAEPAKNSAIAEADYFCKIVSCKPGEILCLDFETTYYDPVKWCRDFLDRVTSNMGFKPLIYLNLGLVKSYDWSPVINAGYGLWLAHYDQNPNQVDSVPWNTVAIKQFSSTGTVDGLSPVDLDIFYGDAEQFKKYGNPPPPPPQTPPPTTTETSSTTISTSSTTSSSTTTLTTLTMPPMPPPGESPIQLFNRFLGWLKKLLGIKNRNNVKIE